MLTEAAASLLKRALVQGNIAGFLAVGSERRLFLRDEKVQLQVSKERTERKGWVTLII